MDTYKKMYLELLDSVEEAIQRLDETKSMLINAKLSAEEMYIEADVKN